MARKIGKSMFVCAMALSIAVLSGTATATDSNWIKTSSSTWHTVANWDLGIPNAVGDIARFPNILASSTFVTVDADATIGEMYIVEDSCKYQFQGDISGRKLIMDNGVSTALIDYAITGQDAYFLPTLKIVMGSDLDIKNSSPAKRLCIQGGIDGSTAGTDGRTLTLDTGTSQILQQTTAITGGSAADPLAVVVKGNNKTGWLQLAASSDFWGSWEFQGSRTYFTSDAHLGDPNNDLTFNGGALLVDNTITLGAKRTVTMTGAGTLNVYPGRTLTLGTAGQLTGAGTLTKSNLGILEITADMTGFTGNVNVTGGLLNVNGITSEQGNYVVSDGAALGGTGTIGLAADMSVTVDLNARLAPGNSADTLTVDGNMIFSDGAIYDWQYDIGVADLVDVNGVLTLGTIATVNVQQLNGASLPGTLTLFTADALAGATSLSGWTVNGLPGYTAAIDGNNVILLPEPATMAILAFGICAVLRRRRNR